jgi:tetratricopeptide (TPR) repeat protein
MLERALAIGGLVGDCDGVLHARAWMVHTFGMAGQFREALEFAATIEHRPEDVARNPYPMIKARGGIAYCATGLGDMQRARDEADTMIAFGRGSGNARAEAFGHQQECCWRIYALDFVGAEAAGRRGLAAARDEIFRASCATYTAFALMSNGQYDEVGAITDEAAPKYRRLGDYWHGLPLAALAASRAIADGQLSRGTRALLEATEDARRRGYGYFVVNMEIVIARLHVMTARRDVETRATSVMKNPWFVTRHALPASRMATRELERLVGVATRDAPGFLGLIELSRAELYSHLGQRDRAMDALARLLSFMEATGLGFTPPAVARIQAELAS